MENLPKHTWKLSEDLDLSLNHNSDLVTATLHALNEEFFSSIGITPENLKKDGWFFYTCQETGSDRWIKIENFLWVEIKPNKYEDEKILSFYIYDQSTKTITNGDRSSGVSLMREIHKFIEYDQIRT